MSSKNDIKTFRSLLNGYKISQILMALEDLRVFSAIAETEGDINSLSEKVGVPAEKLQPLLNCVVHHGLLEKSGNVFSFSGDAILNPNSSLSQNGYLRFSQDVRNKWLGLGDVIKGDEQGDLDLVTGGDIEQTRNFISAMNSNAVPQAKFITEKFDFSGRKILDIGCGSGVFSIAVGEAYPDSHGLLFDLPGVTPISKEYLTKSAVSARFSVESGDYHSAIPSGVFSDVFLFAIIHQENFDQAKALVKEVRSRLKIGGRLFLTSFFLEEDRTDPEFSALFAVEMLVMLKQGRVFTFSEIESILSEEDFSFERVDSIPGPATLYIATCS